jgi:ketosteroid isomerase-like protein
VAVTADGAAVVLAFVSAFNAEDLDGLAEVLDPDVVIHSARGTRYGVDDALAWAGRVSTGDLDQRIDLESIKVEGDRAVALVRKQWWWRESGELAREDEMAWAFELRDGRVASWQSFEDRGEALAAAGVEA